MHDEHIMDPFRIIQLKFVDGWDLSITSKDFIRSLGINNIEKDKIYTLRIHKEKHAQIFGMPISLSGSEFPDGDYWECSIVNQDGSKRLVINKSIIAAVSIKNDQLASTIGFLPNELKNLNLSGNSIKNLNCISHFDNLTSLSLAGCNYLEDISFLENQKSLKLLALGNCKSINNIKPLSELKILKILDLTNCYKIKNIDSISNLKSLNWLRLDSCTEIQDITALSELASVIYLHLYGCESIFDISVISNLITLKDLNLARCSKIKTIDALCSLKSLKKLNLAECVFLSDTSPLAGLTTLRELNLSNCRGISNINAISNLSLLEKLDLSECESLADINILSELKSLKELKLINCLKISNINAISNHSIQKLDLHGCESLTDFNPLASLTSIQKLDLQGCGSLTDLNPLASLTSLTELNLTNCRNLHDIKALSNLKSIKYLYLGGCGSISNIAALSGLTSLTLLLFGGCRSLKNINALTGLKSLTSLNLSNCGSLTDITAPLGLTSLTSLDLRRCYSLTDITALSDLTSLTSLDLSSCKSLTDITALSDLTSLSSLDLSNCKSLSDITALSGLTSLTSLNLSSCESLTDITALSGLTSLTSLNLSECEKIRNLAKITRLTKLKKLDISDLKRLPPGETLEHLRSFTALEELDSPFNPTMVAELLAQTAVCRHDLNKISQSAREWLQESIDFSDGDLSEQEQFAATLGSAFSLLGDHEVVPDYEAFLDERTDFSATPWKAWLGGLKKNQGHAALVRSVERVDLALRSAGAIGGICAALPSSEAPAEEKEWARDWLARMETAQASNAKNLISVCAEICLAHARLGLQEALQRWLGRFTDASDPEALDPVHDALGHWQLQQGDMTAASEHAWSIRASQVRDPLLGKLVDSCYKNDPALACKALLHIDSLSLRTNLAIHLVAQETFAAEARNMQCLIVACDNSIEAMAQFITQAHPKADPKHLRALSEKLRQQSQLNPENEGNSHHNEIR